MGARLTLVFTSLLLFGCSDDSAVPASSMPAQEFGVTTPDFVGRDEREPCHQQYPHKRAFFGELHIHSSLSFDSWVFGNDNGPESAYDFARGQQVLSGPIQRPLRIDRPLDFAAVTDHSELFATMNSCTVAGSPDYDHKVCKTLRGDVWWARLLPDALSRLARIFSTGGRGPAAVNTAELCPGDASCTRASRPTWERIQHAAEQAYDRSADCQFTTLVGYEYSLTNAAGNNLHRNVLFRNATVLNYPVNANFTTEPQKLWSILDSACNSDSRCQALAIPHNSNLSAGEMFHPGMLYTGNLEQQRELAALRARTEPLAEIFQLKGDSECSNLVSGVFGGADEFCEFEKIRHRQEAPADCGDEVGEKGMAMTGCVSRHSFVRYALAEGLAQRQRLGVNPLELGIIAATDAHESNAGDVDEYDFSSGLVLNDTPQERLQPEIVLPGGIASVRQARFNPGGVAGVYAHENSREALFDALRQREVFGTSGPRIAPRFFAGQELQPDLCDQPDMLQQAYASAVPMGGSLQRTDLGGRSPQFLVAAQADAGTRSHPGTPLQRLQIVKAWIDAQGQLQQRVHDIAGDSDSSASVDPASCERSGHGYERLCAVWQDPEDDPERDAVYYARAIENPSCRWSAYQCASLPAAERPATCDDPNYPHTVQERAWTSPIWVYTPLAP